MNSWLCIYHSHCLDGFGAAWSVLRGLKKSLITIEWQPGVHHNPPIDVTGKHVILVDFCYKADAMKTLIQQATSTLVLDHHKTAVTQIQLLLQQHTIYSVDLNESSKIHCWDAYRTYIDSQSAKPHSLAYLFDMNRSGAGISWDFFHPQTARPRLIEHIEDGDLWRFQLEQTREIIAALGSYPYEFAQWDLLMAQDSQLLAREGEIIRRKHNKDLFELVTTCRRTIEIAGYPVPAASLPPTMASDAGHLLAEGQAFSATYYDTAKYRVFSLRSGPTGLDVAEIASRYGGGGHKHAAGFNVPRDHPLAQS